MTVETLSHTYTGITSVCPYETDAHFLVLFDAEGNLLTDQNGKLLRINTEYLVVIK